MVSKVQSLKLDTSVWSNEIVQVCVCVLVGGGTEAYKEGIKEPKPWKGNASGIAGQSRVQCSCLLISNISIL